MTSPRPEGSGFRAFWTSLPGVLTGVAAVVGAVAALAGVFSGGDGDGDAGTNRSPATATTAARVTASAGATSTGDGSCLDHFLSGIAADRRARVEVGAEYATIIPPHRRLPGRLGVVLLRAGRPLGAVRALYEPEGYLFPLEAVVDARCRPAPHEDPEGGEPDVIQGGRTTRITLAGGQYDFSLGASVSIVASLARFQG
jgi:hypothetical protein